jgi:glycosyltransferase involved in cell wall biosynthesis
MKKKILVVTPAFFGGSWICVSRILERLVDNEISIIGMGNNFLKNKKFKYFTFPYPRYDKWGHYFANIPSLSFIWTIPLIFVSILFFFIKRPNLIIANGFSSAMVLSFFAKIFECNVIVIHNGFIGNHLSGLTSGLVRRMIKFIDLVVVNSRGSFEDVLQIVEKSKVIVNEHYADDIFFDNFKANSSSSEFTVLYIGRLDKEKLFTPLLDIAKKLKNDIKFSFIFSGTGELQSEIEDLAKSSPCVKYVGYTESRSKVKELYNLSDILWTYADETYLSLPAVEALASGRPIVVPILSALPEKTIEGIEIRKDLVPEKIGWTVDTTNLKLCYKLIYSIGINGVKQSMRRDCREYAKLHYSSKNLERTITKISSYI